MCNCPLCNWLPPEDDFYYCRNGKAIKCTKFSMASPKSVSIEFFEDSIQSIEPLPDGDPQLYVFGKPPFRHLKCYPKIENFSTSPYASYEFGVSGQTWDETHKCPVCKKEYSFDNSDY